MQCAVRMNTILAELTPEELAEVEELLVHQQLKKGEVIFCEGEKMHGSYIVKSGAVKLYKRSREGERQILRVLKEGKIAGLCALRTKSNYGHTAETMEKSILCYLNKNKLDKLLSLNEDLSSKFLKVLADEIDRAYEKIYLLGTKSAKEKMANFLMSLAAGKNEPVQDGIELQLAMSRDDIADMLGISTETAIRVLSEFKDKDLISGKGKYLTIDDVGELEKIADEF